MTSLVSEDPREPPTRAAAGGAPSTRKTSAARTFGEPTATPPPCSAARERHPLRWLDALSLPVALGLALASSVTVMVVAAELTSLPPVMLVALLLPALGAVMVVTARGRLEQTVLRRRGQSIGAMAVIVGTALVVPVAMGLDRVWPWPEPSVHADAEIPDVGMGPDLGPALEGSSTSSTGGSTIWATGDVSTTAVASVSTTAAADDNGGGTGILMLDLGTVVDAWPEADPGDPETYLEDPAGSGALAASPDPPALVQPIAPRRQGFLGVPDVMMSRGHRRVPTLTPDDLAEMVLIEGGAFTDGRGQSHTIDTFYMDITEVTMGEYQICVDEEICAPADIGFSCNVGVQGREDHPVNCVDWEQAVTYCRWARRRLPTEWEWEWAARGREEGRTYPWGNSPGPSCRRVVMQFRGRGRAGCGKDSTWAVGSKPRGKSRDGLKDMAGNVSEWTASPSDGEKRVLRGGSWLLDFPSFLRAGYRGSDFDPTNRDDFVGFRCARTAAASE